MKKAARLAEPIVLDWKGKLMVVLTVGFFLFVAGLATVTVASGGKLAVAYMVTLAMCLALILGYSLGQHDPIRKERKGGKRQKRGR